MKYIIKINEPDTKNPIFNFCITRARGILKIVSQLILLLRMILVFLVLSPFVLQVKAESNITTINVTETSTAERVSSTMFKLLSKVPTTILQNTTTPTVTVKESLPRLTPDNFTATIKEDSVSD